MRLGDAGPCPISRPRQGDPTAHAASRGILRPTERKHELGELRQVSTTSILLLTAAAEEFAPAVEALRSAGHEVAITADADEAIRRAGDFRLLIVDTVEPPRTGVDVCAEVRGTPALAGIPVLCVSQADDVEERVRFLEAGADDVVARPFDPRELEARVEGLVIRFQRSRDLAPLTAGDVPVAGRRHLIACFSPKGGVGTTTIAVNIAVALAARAPGRIAILDLDMDFGQVATHLNVKPRLTIADLASDDTSLREPDLLKTYAETVEPGLYVIGAPPNPEHGRLVEPAQVGQLMTTAPAAFQTLVIDLGSTLDERTLTVLDRADAVVVPIIPEVAALKALHGFLEFVTEEGTVIAKSSFVLNHLFARDMLTMRQIESAIAARVDAELPYDAGLYLKAVNEGIPVVRGAPTSAPGRALAHLATRIAGISDDTAAAQDGRRGSLFAGIRRRG